MAKSTKNQLDLLELENIKMEQRLQQFKQQMDQAKEARKKHGWRSAQQERGALSNYASDVLARRKRFSGLSQQVQQEAKHVEKPVDKLVQQDSLDARPPRPAQKILEPTPPKLWKVDEDQMNFSSTKNLFDIDTPRNDRRSRRQVPQEVAASAEGLSRPSLLDGQYNEQQSSQSFQEALMEWRTKKPSLFDGTYNEQESSQSFQDALKQWRQSGQPNSGTQSEKEQADQSIDFARVRFKASMSYLDRLKLSQLREGIFETPQKTIDVRESLASQESDVSSETIEKIDTGASLAIETAPAIRATEPPAAEAFAENRTEYLITVQDITDIEDKVVNGLLEKGVMVECVPSRRLVFINPVA